MTEQCRGREEAQNKDKGKPRWERRDAGPGGPESVAATAGALRVAAAFPGQLGSHRILCTLDHLLRVPGGD